MQMRGLLARNLAGERRQRERREPAAACHKPRVGPELQPSHRIELGQGGHEPTLLICKTDCWGGGAGSAALFTQRLQLDCEMHDAGQMQILQQRGQPRLALPARYVALKTSLIN